MSNSNSQKILCMPPELRVLAENVAQDQRNKNVGTINTKGVRAPQMWQITRLKCGRFPLAEGFR